MGLMMPEYPYEDTQTGERVDLFRSMAQADPIGSVIEHEGRTLRRLASDGVRTQDAGFRPFTSATQARYDPDAPRHDKAGRAQFQSRREVSDFIAKKNARGGKQIVWDG